MEAGLLVFVFDVDTSCALFIEQYLTEGQFEVIFSHVIGRTIVFIEPSIGDVKSSSIAVGTIGCSVDVSAPLKVTYRGIRAGDGCNDEAIVWAAVSL